MTLFYILIFVFILGLVILVHETGHFIFAKRAGILCHEFSIGMGPALYKKKIGETVYAIRAIPIGGYVAAAGEDPETAQIKIGQTVYLEIKNNIIEKIYLNRPLSGNTVEGVVTDFDLYGKDGNPLFISYRSEGVEHRVHVKRDAMYVFNDKQQQQIAPYDRCYESKPWLNRFLFVTMGAGFNFILAFLVFILVYLISGVPTTRPVIDNPQSDMYLTAAEAAGLQKGDRIVQLNGTKIKKWSDIADFMDNHDGRPIVITFERDGEKHVSEANPRLAIATIGVISDGKPLDDTVIGGVQPNSPADKAGLKKGDRIIRIGDVTVGSWSEFTDQIYKIYYEPQIKKFMDGSIKKISLEDVDYKITFIRDGEEKTVSVKPLKLLISYSKLKKDSDKEIANIKTYLGDYYLGVSPKTERGLFKSIAYGFKVTLNQIENVFKTLGLLVGNNNVGVSDLSGPVGIFDMTKTHAMSGFMSLLFWLGFISANIGFVNLLPLPALDGGRLLFLLIEGVTRRPINRKIEGYIHTVGFILLMLLFIYVTFNDILRLRG